MPEGAAFSAVFKETRDGLPACKLRVSQKSAADKIWEDYGSGRLMMILKSHLLEGLVPEAGHNVTMKINIMKEEYETACDILAGKLAKRKTLMQQVIGSTDAQSCLNFCFGVRNIPNNSHYSLAH